MTLNKVSVVCDVYDGGERLLLSGTGYWQPSVTVTDAADHVLVAPSAQITAVFRPTGSPQVSLLACDNAALLPAGWRWTWTPPSGSGLPAQTFNVQAGPAAFTATNASPCVFTATAPTGQPWTDGQQVTLSGASLPGGFTAGTYYLTGTSGSTFRLAATQGGTAIGSTSAGSGDLTVASVYLSQMSPVATAVATFPLNPMTALGDMVYGGASPAGTPERLAGSTSADMEVLTQAGNGTASAAPAWLKLFNDRGAIAASTAYSPGDTVAYQGQRVLVTQAVTSSAWSNWYAPPTLAAGTYVPVTSDAVYYAADWGVVADGVTDNGPALNRALQFMSQGINSGGFLVLPDGYTAAGRVTAVGSTVIVPPGCYIAGSGIETSCVKLLPGADCDVIQFQTDGSASQAAIISAATGASIGQFSLRNAFYAGLVNLCVHGANTLQGAGQYNSGVNMTTSPLSTAASSDPDFDPYNLLFNVEIRSCTGDGLYHAGRGGFRCCNVLSRYNQGWNYVPSFDSLYAGCNAGEGGIGGFYVAHGSCSGAAAKSYNNGTNAQWVSGFAYSALTPVMYSGAMYRSINAVTSSTPPPSDPANWAALTATAPQYWGYGFAWDAASEESWVACDSQENAAGDYYLHNCTAMAVQGVSALTNYQAASNPGSLAAVTLDGSSGCTVDVAFSQLNSLAYVLKALNGAARNDVRMTGDTSYQGILSPDSIALAGNSVKVNGTSLTDTLAALTDVALASPQPGQILVWNGTGWVNENSAAGASPFLAASQYAPAAQVTLATASAAFAAVDSANVHTGTFTAPASGSVVVTASFAANVQTVNVFTAFALALHGTTTMAGYAVEVKPSTTETRAYSLSFLVTGLTGGNAYDLDLMFAVSGAASLQVLAVGQSAAVPSLANGSVGAPVVMTVQAV